ncbi:hypothetical protein LIER_29431 [Lithospermum erythrorhizon]|uniref:Uncharacterized protein n=1 Tax=Lithospermum erythrorhizon TaxID=34254 RepID=A0AAV3RK53_LITER
MIESAEISILTSSELEGKDESPEDRANCVVLVEGSVARVAYQVPQKLAYGQKQNSELNVEQPNVITIGSDGQKHMAKQIESVALLGTAPVLPASGLKDAAIKVVKPSNTVHVQQEIIADLHFTFGNLDEAKHKVVATGDLKHMKQVNDDGYKDSNQGKSAIVSSCTKDGGQIVADEGLSAGASGKISVATGNGENQAGQSAQLKVISDGKLTRQTTSGAELCNGIEDIGETDKEASTPRNTQVQIEIVKPTWADMVEEEQQQARANTLERLWKRFQLRNSIDLPINFDPIMCNQVDDVEMNWSQLIENKVKLGARRSVSPEGTSSRKLTKLRNRVDYLDHDTGKAPMVDMKDYLETHKVQFQVEYQDSPPPPSRDFLHRPRHGHG